MKTNRFPQWLQKAISDTSMSKREFADKSKTTHTSLDRYLKGCEPGACTINNIAVLVANVTKTKREDVLMEISCALESA